MFVKTSENSYYDSYYVGFELDRSKPQAVTYCKILLLIANEPPILVGSGKALQSKTDVFNSVTGCTFALKQALADYGFQNSTKILFWKEFNRCYRRQNIATCRKTSSDECQHRIMAKGGGTDWCKQYSDYCRSPKTKTTVPGYGGLYTFRQEQAAKAEAARAKAGGTVKPGTGLCTETDAKIVRSPILTAIDTSITLVRRNKMTKDEAQAIADKWACQLEDKWTPELWENVGWHVRWVNGVFKLHYSEPNQNFYVLIGHIDFEEAFSIHRKDPVAAIQAAAKAAQEIYRKDWMPIIASIEMILQN